MRYVRWIIVMLVLLLVILEMFYNFEHFTEATFTFAFQLLPGKVIFKTELPVWQGMLVTFLLGFGLAFMFEIYYWLKYTLHIRSQNKIITRLQKALDSLMPSHHEAKAKDQARDKDQKPAAKKPD